MGKFEYHEPKSLKDACSLLSRLQGKGVAIAGGTDLLVNMEEDKLKPDHLINLKAISDVNLQGIRYDENGGLVLGALTRIREIEKSDLIKEKFPILTQATHVMGTVQSRNLATVGGNLCNASPAADMAPPLICLGSKLRIVGTDGERSIMLEDFFKGPGQTVLRPGEIVTEIQVPPMLSYSKGVYFKHTIRRMLDLAIVGVGVVINWEPSTKVCKEVKIALGAVAPTPIRSKKSEEMIKGKKITESMIESAAEKAMEESKPIDDHRSSAEYRRHMVGILTKRGISSVVS
jgi:carbon-monoxide dehydrogenase medium subunit